MGPKPQSCGPAEKVLTLYPSDLLLTHIQIDSKTLLWQVVLVIYTFTPRHKYTVENSVQPQGKKQVKFSSAQHWKQDGWAFCSIGQKQGTPEASFK